MQVESLDPAGRPPERPGLLARWNAWADRSAGNVFVLPSVLIVLVLSIFPLLVSLYLSVSRFQFVRGGFEINFVGLDNYRKLLVGTEQRHFLGKLETPTLAGWIFVALVAALLAASLWRFARGEGFSLSGLFWRLLSSIFLVAGAYLVARTLTGEGLPGTLVVTLIFVFIGVLFQYLVGLGLALLTTQNLPGRRFFRVIFLLPMMITPVGVAYMFRMLTDTSKGPFKPIWFAAGLGDFSWVETAWGARTAVLVGDIWQWTPFMFIVLLAALEGQSMDQIEAALVDGASRWQTFRFVVLPQILPVSTTVILIRFIEAFKIVDLPQVMTRGGPGTATESLTLHSYLAWRALDLGGSAAVAYLLLFVVTFLGLTYVNFVRRRLVGSI